MASANPHVRVEPLPDLPMGAYFEKRPPWHVLALCADFRLLSPGAQSSLSYLWAKSTREGPPDLWHFAETLADGMGCVVRTLQRRCLELISKGWLAVQARHRTSDGFETSSRRLLLRPPCLRGGDANADGDEMGSGGSGSNHSALDNAGSKVAGDVNGDGDGSQNGETPDDGGTPSIECRTGYDATVAPVDPVHEKSFQPRNPSLDPPRSPRRRKAGKPDEAEDRTLTAAVLKSLANVTRTACHLVSFDSLDGSTVKAIATDIQRESQLGTWARWRRMAPRYPEIWRVLRWKLGGTVEAVQAGVEREAEAATARDTEAHTRALDSHASESRSWLDSQPPPATPELLELWRQTLEGMEERIGAKGVEVWFRSLHPIDVAGDALRLQACNSYYAEHIGESYGDELAAELAALRGVPTSVTFVLRGEM